MGQITLDMDSFANSLREYIHDLTERTISDRKGAPTFEEIRESAEGIVSEALLRRMRPDTTDWVRPVSDAVTAIFREMNTSGNRDKRVFDLLRQLMDYEDRGADPAVERARARDTADRMIAAAREQMVAVTRTIEQAVGRVPEWHGTRVRVDPGLAESIFDRWADDRPLVTTASVNVGREPSFTLFLEGDRIDQVEDVLEGGDPDFFADPGEQADYFNLVKELQRPGSSARGRDLTLWTARPVKDRERYERARTVPPNIFLTNDPDRAYGLAQEGELGGGVRDVWRVVINEAHLVQTLESGRMKDFQAVGRGPVPVKSMTLDMPAPSTGAGRVAARWLSR